MEQDQFMTASHQKDLTDQVGQGFATNVSVSQAWLGRGLENFCGAVGMGEIKMAMNKS
jgi:hypothetical protein